MGDKEALRQYREARISYTDDDSFCLPFALDGILGGGKLSIDDYDWCCYHNGGFDGALETQLLLRLREKGLIKYAQYTLSSMHDHPVIKLLHQSIDSDKVAGILLVEPCDEDIMHLFSIKGPADWLGRIKYFDTLGPHMIGITGFEDALRRATHSIRGGFIEENNVTVVYKGPNFASI